MVIVSPATYPVPPLLIVTLVIAPAEAVISTVREADPEPPVVARAVPVV
jgi:hypothetical protein